MYKNTAQFQNVYNVAQYVAGNIILSDNTFTHDAGPIT